MHCSTGQGKLDSPLFSAALQNSLTADLCHCNYTYGDLLFIQMCNDTTAMHCNTGQGKVDSPLFSAALRNSCILGLIVATDGAFLLTPPGATCLASIMAELACHFLANTALHQILICGDLVATGILPFCAANTPSPTPSPVTTPVAAPISICQSLPQAPPCQFPRSQ